MTAPTGLAPSSSSSAPPADHPPVSRCLNAPCKTVLCQRDGKETISLKQWRSEDLYPTFLFVCLFLGRLAPPFKPPFGSKHPSSLKRHHTLKRERRAKSTISPQREHRLAEAAFSDAIPPSIPASGKKFTRGTVPPGEGLLHSWPGVRLS